MRVGGPCSRGLASEREAMRWTDTSPRTRVRRRPFIPAPSPYSDPVVVLVLAISFVFSVVVLHVGSKLARIFLK